VQLKDKAKRNDPSTCRQGLLGSIKATLCARAPSERDAACSRGFERSWVSGDGVGERYRPKIKNYTRKDLQYY